jgi:tetratricopeptide (TPR) repeat protein
VTGLIGFGGEGKSSLARRWLDDLLALVDESQPHPDGVFWWGFYEKRNVDEFFEAALAFLTRGRVDVREYPSANARVQLIAKILGLHRYLFVLDGLEVMQHQEGDQYGLLTSGDLREFLEYFAAPGHASFCLVTSRAPVLDLIEHETYRHRDVMRLSPADGHALLREVGVVGADEDVDRVVAEWDGHALTLSLLGGYLADRHSGDVTKIGEIPPPTAGEPRYERVHRVLRRYDEHLTDAERAFLTLFSAFRTPVHESAFERVFRPWIEAQVGAHLDAPLQAMIQRLVTYRILRYYPREGTYTAHPLIRNHYSAQLTAGDRVQAQEAHTRIKDYYLELAGDTPYNPTLDDLAPLIEVVHHACRAGAYDEAWQVYRERIIQRDRRVLVRQLGAYETAFALTLKFFLGRDASQEPLVSEPWGKRFILNRAGFCLMSLGRLGEAAPFYEHGNRIALEMEDWHNASHGYGNLAELHAHLGALDESAEAAGEALALARRARNKQDECWSLAHQAWAAHLRGDVETASTLFQQAEVLEAETDSTMHFLYSLRGIWHADHLHRTGDSEYARRVTEANLKICRRCRVIEQVGQCYRVLGNLDAQEDQHESAHAHFGEALRIARGITERGMLIEALLARGRWAARLACQTSEVSQTSKVSAAFNDLNEALGYAVQSGYRIYEAGIRVALAWAYLAAGDPDRARQEAARARQVSEQMGYHWGRVDAAEVLAALDEAA